MDFLIQFVLSPSWGGGCSTSSAQYLRQLLKIVCQTPVVLTGAGVSPLVLQADCMRWIEIAGFPCTHAFFLLMFHHMSIF